MRSKTSFFNGTVFRSNLSRFWPIWCAQIILLLLLVPSPLATTLSRERGTDIYDVGRQLLSQGTLCCAPLNAVLGVVSAMAVYSFMYSSRSVGMAAALPLRREGLFLTCWLSGLSWLVGASVLTAAVCVVVELCFGALAIEYILLWLAVCVLQAVFFYGLASICAVLTGTLYILPAVYAIFNFLAVIVESLIRCILSIFVFGISADIRLSFRFLSPFCEMMRMRASILADSGGAVTGLIYNGLPTLICYAAAGLIMSALALLLYKRRRMEAASDVVAIPVLKPVFRYCLAFGFSITLGMAMYYLIFENFNNNLLPAATSVIICVLVAGFMGYFAAEMLMRKSFKVFDKWRGYVVFAVIAAALILATDLDAFGFERYIPDAGRTAKATVTVNGDSVVSSDAAGIDDTRSLHSILLGSRNSEAAENVYAPTIVIEYELKNGRTVMRQYKAVDETLEPLDKIFNSTDAILERNLFTFEVNAKTVSYANVYSYGPQNAGSFELTNEQGAQLYNECIVPDMKDGLLGRIPLSSFSAFATPSDKDGPSWDVTLCLVEHDWSGDYSEIRRDYYVTQEAYRTMEFIQGLASASSGSGKA